MSGRDWRDMSRELFDVDAAAPGLFDPSPAMTAAPDDGAGTGDLLAELADMTPAAMVAAVETLERVTA